MPGNDRKNINTKVVTRYAPSPTGFQHIGGIRTALFAYLLARQNGGTFILRIEDTDRERFVTGAIEHTMEALAWVGIDWDYGPNKEAPFGSCIQSERLSIYKTYAEKLIAKGLAYPDPYTQEEVETFRKKAEVEKRPFLFRNHRPEVFDTWDGTKPLRLKAPHIKRYQWTDAVRGELEAGEEAVDDIILIKADGYPTYNFAHIIDDLEMGVTHIMRGDEFISSMPKFLSIYDALEIPYPTFVTLPPILKDDRTKKLGKRDGAKDILTYREEGYLPEVMMNFLALIGWNPGTEQEILSKEELISLFSITHIQKGGGAFNEEKLDWMNKEYLQKMSSEDFFTYVKEVFEEKFSSNATYNSEVLQRAVALLRERVHTQKALREEIESAEYDFFFLSPEVTQEQVKWKNDSSTKDALPRLKKAHELLESADFSSPSAIKESLWAYAEEVGKGELLWPLRVSLTGRERSPDPFMSAYILGKVETLSRIKNACAKIGE